MPDRGQVVDTRSDRQAGRAVSSPDRTGGSHTAEDRAVRQDASHRLRELLDQRQVLDAGSREDEELRAELLDVESEIASATGALAEADEAEDGVRPSIEVGAMVAYTEDGVEQPAIVTGTLGSPDPAVRLIVLASQHGGFRDVICPASCVRPLDEPAHRAAQWMLDEIHRDGHLYQCDAVEALPRRFGAGLVYTNARGHEAIRSEVLAVFRAMSGDQVVWSRGGKYWRLREHDDEPGREQRR